MAVLLGTLACAQASMASLIFQAGFNGSGTGTGGTADIVASGGTGALASYSGSPNAVNSVATTNPFATGAGGYVNSTIAAGSSSAKNIVTFTPAARANSWAAMVGATITAGGVNYVSLNGGFDMFVRPLAGEAGFPWFRPIDFSTISGSSGARLILNGTGSGTLQLQLVTGAALGVGSAPGSFTKNTTISLAGNMGSVANPLTLGVVAHIGVTFKTDATGMVTMKLFGVSGAGEISTTSDTVGVGGLLAKQTFYASADAIGSSVLTPGAWTVSARTTGGNFVFTSIDYDGIRLYDSDPGVFAGLSPLPAPIILRASDGVAPGSAFTVFGEGFAAASVEVAIAPDGTGGLPAEPPSDALRPAVLQTDKDGHFVVVRMPWNAPAGVYNLWVRSGAGWSACAKLNAARPLFMSDYQAFNGIDIEVVGRNFDRLEFGGSTATSVRLNNGSGGIHGVTLKDLNPYHLTFTVGGQPTGDYFVEVSNDGGLNWRRLSNGQKLTILTAPTGTWDPLGLNVPWAKDFNWANEKNPTITNYGGGLANGSDTVDDTAAIQAAIDTAENQGGGVVYLPPGDYRATRINLGTNVVLKGAGKDSTTILYNGTGGSTFISTKGYYKLNGVNQYSDRHGLANLGVKLASTDRNMRPDVMIKLGDTHDGSNYLPARQATRVFISGVKMDYPFQPAGYRENTLSFNDSVTGAGGIAYTGAWTASTNRAADAQSPPVSDYGSDVHLSSDPGASFSFTFTGNSVFYVTETGPTQGNVDLYIDGVFQKRVNCYSATRKCYQTVAFFAGFTNVNHTFQAVRVDGEIMVDVMNVGQPRGIGFLSTAKERLLFQNNDFKGWAATNTSAGCGYYSILRNNRIEYATGYMGSSATYAFFENNEIIAHPELQQESHGIFPRSDAYVANNSITGTGADSILWNDGEGICAEGPGGAFNHGSVASATATSLTVNPLVTLVNPSLYYGELCIVITQGRGIGQLRRVSVDAATNTLNIVNDAPFDIVPDATSWFTLFAPLKNFTIYNNTVTNCLTGITPYGNAFDDVVANNTITNCDGVYIHAVTGGINTTADPDFATGAPSYFVRVVNNTVTGVSRRGNRAGIGTAAGRWNLGDGTSATKGVFQDVQHYGTEILRNKITGDRFAVPFTDILNPETGKMQNVSGLTVSGIYVLSYGGGSYNNGIGTGDTTNTLIEGNDLWNLKGGIYLSRCDYGQLVSNNYYDATVLTFLNHTTTPSDNTFLTGNFQRGTLAASATGVSAATGTSAGQIEIQWNPSTGAQNYVLQRSTTSGSGYATIATVDEYAIGYVDADTTLAAGQTYYYRVAASNTAGLSAYSSTASSTPYVPAGIAGWRYVNFGAAGLQPTMANGAADLANPSGDGISNLLKYAYGLDPNASDSTHAPKVTLQNVSGSFYLQISYRQRKDATDLGYIVQVGNDLATWNSGPSYTSQVSQTDNGDGTYTVVVRDLTPTSVQPKRFIRLIVNLIP